MSRDLLLKDGIVVTVDDKLGDLQDADVLIRDGAIVAVGSGVRSVSADAEVIDCKGRLVIPGLVDTHRHVELLIRSEPGQLAQLRNAARDDQARRRVVDLGGRGRAPARGGP